MHLERKNGFEVPLYNIANWVLAKNHRRYGAIALRFQCNGDAITP